MLPTQNRNEYRNEAKTSRELKQSYASNANTPQNGGGISVACESLPCFRVDQLRRVRMGWVPGWGGGNYVQSKPRRRSQRRKRGLRVSAVLRGRPIDARASRRLSVACSHQAETSSRNRFDAASCFKPGEREPGTRTVRLPLGPCRETYSNLNFWSLASQLHALFRLRASGPPCFSSGQTAPLFLLYRFSLFSIVLH